MQFVCTSLKSLATSTFEELSRKLANRDIEGALVDSYVAAYHKDKFGKFRVNNIIQAPKAFGMVLGPKLSTAYLYGRFNDYLEEKKAQVLKDIENNTNTLTVSKMLEFSIFLKIKFYCKIRVSKIRKLIFCFTKFINI